MLIDQKILLLNYRPSSAVQSHGASTQLTYSSQTPSKHRSAQCSCETLGVKSSRQRAVVSSSISWFNLGACGSREIKASFIKLPHTVKPLSQTITGYVKEKRLVIEKRKLSYKTQAIRARYHANISSK